MSDLNLADLRTAMAADPLRGESIYEFLSARTLNTTVPPY